ncbi:MAG: PIG-L family deacetylase [Cyclobacteriaceae bacterium]
MTLKAKISALFLAFITISTFAQKPKQLLPGEIKQGLKKLNVFGTMLYVAAHPDDENTRLIAYYANEALYNSAYLSCTRGDGGQNLVGSEIRELLGIIRTQELLAARRTDGGNQFFTRANDFGYSKNPEETFNFWEKEDVLADMVWTIRKLRPDVIITRFPPDARAGHGHHTASAILAIEAYDAAADKNRFPEQLKHFEPWQVKRVIWNTHPFWFSRRGLEFDSAAFLSMDAGKYNPLLGQSYGEIAAVSRTNHKSQGFGSTGARGTNLEWFELLAGDSTSGDPFEGINTKWDRIEGAEEYAGHVENANLNFDPEKPWIVLDDLVKAYKSLPKVKDTHWRWIKQQEIRELIQGISGLYLEVKASDYSFTPGDSIKLNVEVINRSQADLTLASLNFRDLGGKTELNQKLQNDSPFLLDKATIVPEDQPFSQPYWLKENGTLGMYEVEDQLKRGLPENEPALSIEATIKIGDQFFDYELPVIYKRNDPVDGEVYRPLEISPPVTLNIEEKVYVFADNEPREVIVNVKAAGNDLTGSVKLDLPKEWRSEPASVDYNLSIKGSEETIMFSVFPPKNQDTAEIRAIATVNNGQEYDQSLVRIEYDHIPTQTLYPTSNTKLVKLDIQRKGQNIGYIAGAGDEIPASLEQIGYRVWELQDEEITAEKLADFDAVIIGIRAYNTNDRLKFHQDKLFDYVEKGGTMIVQYNTSFRLVTDNIAPDSLTMGRDRVSVEEADIRVLKPDHPVLNYPNKITKADFDNWVQERGLYFPSDWSENFEAILSSNDPGEDPRDGGLLVLKHGKGHYIYTGYSWFRQLPAGVPGAYRIFTNMISIGKDDVAVEESGSGKE